MCVAVNQIKMLKLSITNWKKKKVLELDRCWSCRKKIAADISREISDFTWSMRREIKWQESVKLACRPTKTETYSEMSIRKLIE